MKKQLQHLLLRLERTALLPLLFLLILPTAGHPATEVCPDNVLAFEWRFLSGKAPRSGDYNFMGEIYRPVHLIVGGMVEDSVKSSPNLSPRIILQRQWPLATNDYSFGYWKNSWRKYDVDSSG